MKLLVMGAGYVGMALLRYLQSQPYEVFITTTHKERILELSLYGKRVLLLQPHAEKEFKQLLDSCDAVIILIAAKHAQNYQSTYLDTALRISSAIKNRQRPLYLLYTSSTSVCEEVQSAWVTEDMPLYPKSENAKILLKTEQVYLDCGANTCILRLGGIYGPKRELIDQARYFSGRELPGNAHAPINRIHLEDIVSAIVFCIKHALTGIYHLVNEDHMTRKELYSALCQLASIPPPIWTEISLKHRNTGYKVCNQKIKQAGYLFKYPNIQEITL
jgi:nucleoside-diphosphate-sugar epimerase